MFRFLHTTPNNRIQWMAVYFLITIVCIAIPLLRAYMLPGISIEVVVIEKEKHTVGIITEPELFEFDVNLITVDSLKILGLSDEIAGRWVKFRSTYGEYKSVEDIHSIYGMTDSIIQVIEPFLQFDVQIQEEANFPVVGHVDKSERKQRHAAKKKSNVQYFAFNPNNVSRDALMKLGLSGGVATTWIKFRQSGALFRQVADVAKVYGVESRWVEDVADYMVFEDVEEDEDIEKGVERWEEKRNISSSYHLAMIDINRTSSLEFEKLRGIGKTFAERIIHFREKLGGFYSVDQISEVYGLPDSTFQYIRPRLELNDMRVRTISINNVGKEILEAHPYLSWKDTKIILAYRKQHGEIKNIEEFFQIHGLSEWLKERVSPYLDFESMPITME